MKIFGEGGKLTPEYIKERWNLSMAIQVKLKNRLDASILALTVTEEAPQKILNKLEELKRAVLQYQDMKNAEKECRSKKRN